MSDKSSIPIASEVLTLMIGSIASAAKQLNGGRILLFYRSPGPDAPPLLTLIRRADAKFWLSCDDMLGVGLIADLAWFELLFDRSIDSADGTYHVPPVLRTIIESVRRADHPHQALIVYRHAKAIELLCETLGALRLDKLVPALLHGALSLTDAERVIKAHDIIDLRWREKLTIDEIGRGCGLNRMKMTQGYRELFGCSVNEAIIERRFREAALRLETTDLCIGTIAYEVGYENNASFARAFSQHFGLSPIQFRARHRMTKDESRKPRRQRCLGANGQSASTLDAAVLSV